MISSQKPRTLQAVKPTPDGYPVRSFCASCGRDFSGDSMFDRHRVGKHAYTYSEGLALEPPREDGRRCLDAEEMRELGWRTLSDDEMRATRTHRARAGFGVELWIDPAVFERMQRAF